MYVYVVRNIILKIAMSFNTITSSASYRTHVPLLHHGCSVLTLHIVRVFNKQCVVTSLHRSTIYCTCVYKMLVVQWFSVFVTLRTVVFVFTCKMLAGLNFEVPSVSTYVQRLFFAPEITVKLLALVRL